MPHYYYQRWTSEGWQTERVEVNKEAAVRINKLIRMVGLLDDAFHAEGGQQYTPRYDAFWEIMVEPGDFVMIQDEDGNDY